MEFNLGDLHCIYCNSSKLEFCDWAPDEREKDFDDIYFMSEVEPFIKENITFDPEQEFLFHCSDCNKWFTLAIKIQEQSFTLLPFTKDEDLILTCYLIFDPISLAPQSLQINNINVPILEWSHSTPFLYNRLSENKGPFYPYPNGIYNLLCSIDKTLPDAPTFKLKVTSFSRPIGYRISKNIDLEFFEYSILWYSKEGEEFLKHVININQSINETDFNMMEFIPEALDSNLSIIDTIPQAVSIKISEVASILRNQQAYRFLNWLENELRKLVWEEYKSIYSQDIKTSKWWKGCFPSEVINKIKDNQSNDSKLGQKIDDRFPLAYSDFDNLSSLIEKEWAKINKSLNKDLDIVKGHFKYLKNFRNSIAHSRFLSHQNIMELQYNASKLMSLLGISNFSKKVIFYKEV